MFCSSCGFELTQKTNFCKRCGANIKPPANSVEIHLPELHVTWLVLRIAAFSLIGMFFAMVGFHKLAGRGLPGQGLIVAFLACLFFIFSIAGLLIWQLSRLIGIYQDAVRQTIHKAQFELAAMPQAVVSQPQPVNLPAQKEPIQSSVTEHTTRQMAVGYPDPRTSE